MDKVITQMKILKYLYVFDNVYIDTDSYSIRELLFDTLDIFLNDLLEYMPNLYPATEVEIASGKDIEFKINLDKKFKINFDAPNLLNLLEITGANSANLIKNFDWNEFNDLSISIPPLENGKDYLLQGTFYYCEQAKKSVCKIKSYEQKIIVNRKSSKNSIEFEKQINIVNIYCRT